MCSENQGGPRPVFVDRGEPLPRSYGENRIVALIRDPEHLFAYWDIAGEVRVAGSPLVVRVHCISEGWSHDITPGPDTDNWHLKVAANRAYRLELLERLPGGEMKLLASSQQVSTPVRWSGESGAEPPSEVVLAQHVPLARVDPRVEGSAPRPTRETVRRQAAGSPRPEPTPPPRVAVFSVSYATRTKG